MAGIYIHIPFCKIACHYCDFYFSTNSTQKTQLVDCIVKELAFQQSYLHDESVHTIYLGGGTPSILSPEELHRIYRAITAHFKVDAAAEVTLEANPDDLSSEKLYALKNIGVNRLSIGIQSFDENQLRFFNRAHTVQQALACVPLARAAGFQNINIDILLSIPGQSLLQWEKTIKKALELDVEHISAYSLTIEPQTVFGKWQKKGKLIPANEILSTNQFEFLINTLVASGYEHYEISNFCKPGFVSQHNSGYWKQKNYLGVGPSAHSYNGKSRQVNISNTHLYMKSILNEIVPFEIEWLSSANLINEYIFTSLRTMWGLDLSYLVNHFNYFVEQTSHYKKYMANGFIFIDNGYLKLTGRGKLFADQIASDFFVVE